MPTLILMYHEFADGVRDVAPEHRPYVLTPSTFEEQLECLKNSDLQVVTVAEWHSNRNLSQAVILTFDDGHVSNHRVVLPALRKFGFKGTFFITVGRIGSGDTMHWSQIRDLHAAGMDIGSHTMTHRPPAMLDDRELRYELRESRRILEDGLGAPVTSISSPTGFYNRRMHELAREAGYQTLCSGRVGLVTGHTDPYSLNRIAVKRSLTTRRFEALLRFDGHTIRRMRFEQALREAARETLGPQNYLRARQMIMRVGALFVRRFVSQPRG